MGRTFAAVAGLPLASAFKREEVSYARLCTSWAIQRLFWRRVETCHQQSLNCRAPTASQHGGGLLGPHGRHRATWLWESAIQLMIAILSDIHGNVEAMEAVLHDAATFGIDAVYCLGDLIGCGPDPIPCVQRAMNWRLVVQGNFDKAALGDDDLPGWTAVHARKTVLRFRSQLSEHVDRHAITEFLTSLPSHFVATDAFYVHGSPRNHLYEYLFPEDIYNERKLNAVASHFDSLCFCGHTHIPGIIHRNSSRNLWDYLSPAECDYQYSISKEKVICNVGSVGQPRDGDPRASYVLYTPGTICFRCVEYNAERTIQKMCDEGDSGYVSQRLREGR